MGNNIQTEEDKIKKQFDYKKMNFINVIFLVAIFVILIIPITHINKNEISERENRTLAKYNSIYDIENKKINYNYGKDFDNWLKDRFRGRLKLIHINSTIRLFLSGRIAKLNCAFLDKDNHIMYEASNLKIENFSKEELLQTNKELKKFSDYCKKQNINFYVVIVPKKEMIYPPQKIFKRNDYENKEGLIKLKNHIVNNLGKNISLIFPLEDFINADMYKSVHFPLFYKTDIHATEDGALIGYKALMKEIKKNYPNLKMSNYSDYIYSHHEKIRISTKGKYNWGNICIGTAGLPNAVCEKIYPKKYRYYKNKNENKLKTDTKNEYTRKYFYPEGNNKKALLYGDSFKDNFEAFLPYTFKELMAIKADNIDFYIRNNYEENAFQFKPDIIVVYITYGKSINLLKNINKTY